MRRSLRSLHRSQDTNTTNVSKPRRDSLQTPMRLQSHRSSSMHSVVGVRCWRFARCSQRNQTSLLYAQVSSRWWMVSSDCEQSTQRPLFCMLWCGSLSDVQQREPHEMALPATPLLQGADTVAILPSLPCVGPGDGHHRHQIWTAHSTDDRVSQAPLVPRPLAHKKTLHCNPSPFLLIAGYLSLAMLWAVHIWKTRRGVPLP
jgi:hypothetical protein